MEFNYRLWYSAKSDDYWVVDNSTPWHYSRAMTVEYFVDKVIYKKRKRMKDYPTRNFINLDKFIPGNKEFSRSIDIALLGAGCRLRLTSYQGYDTIDMVDPVTLQDKGDVERFIRKFIKLSTLI